MGWIDGPPDAHGVCGKAWDTSVPQREAAKAKGRWRDDHEASLGMWIFHAEPKQHPAWDWYVMYVVHLRPIEGTPTPTKHFPAATHEFAIFAFDPDKCPPVVGEMDILMPPNVLVQFACTNDLAPVALIKDIAQGLCSGYIGVESIHGGAMTRKNSPHWRAAIETTLQHIITGGHE